MREQGRGSRIDLYNRRSQRSLFYQANYRQRRNETTGTLQSLDSSEFPRISDSKCGEPYPGKRGMGRPRCSDKKLLARSASLGRDPRLSPREMVERLVPACWRRPEAHETRIRESESVSENLLRTPSGNVILARMVARLPSVMASLSP